MSSPASRRNLVRAELRYEHPRGHWIAPNLDWSPSSTLTIDERTRECCWNRLLAGGQELAIIYRDDAVGASHPLVVDVGGEALAVWTEGSPDGGTSSRSAIVGETVLVPSTGGH